MIDLILDIQLPRSSWGYTDWGCIAYRNITVNSIEEFKALDLSPSAIVEEEGVRTPVWRLPNYYRSYRFGSRVSTNRDGNEVSAVEIQNLIASVIRAFIFRAYKTKSRVRLIISASNEADDGGRYFYNKLFRLDLVGYRGIVEGEKRKKLIIRPFDHSRDSISHRRKWQYEVEPNGVPVKEERAV